MIKAKTIWIESENRPDTYAEFMGGFQTTQEDNVYLNLACDSHFAVYINGELACFGEAADYPWYQLYHRVDITKYCSEQNEMKILVWYLGTDSQTYIKGDAGVWFEVTQNDKVLQKSGSHVLSRKNICFKNEYCKMLTLQLGYSFYYDNTVENTLPYTESIESEKMYEFHPRKVGYLTLGERVPVAYSKTTDGYMVDLGEETVGFLELAFTSEKEQEVLIAYGEYLKDGQVARILAERDFSVEFKAKKGENKYLNPLRRLAGRYLQVFCEEPLEIEYIGLRPTDLPVVEIERTFEDLLLQKIYDVSVNTLKKCMHEHYEDCPWREQAMYTLDSRNQMLCGYYAFEGTDYQKENLLFIAKGQREDGLLSLNFPGGRDIPIPMFSLVYLMQVYDYVMHTNETEILAEVRPVIDKILEAFERRIDENGLIANFPYPYWNFYEWAKDSDNEPEILRKPEDPYVKKYDFILNGIYVMACDLYEKLFGEKKKKEAMLIAIRDTFYNPKKGLFKLSTIGETYSQLGNSIAILIGLGTKEIADKMIEDKSLICVTLSMNTFYYDALLRFGDTYKAFVIQDIKEKYGYMLEQGATTFWEYENALGEGSDGSDSLCHGWSSIPVYYMTTLLL